MSSQNFHITGFVSFYLSKPAIKVLTVYVSYVFEEESVVIGPGLLKINCYEKDRDLLIDVLFFIQRNGTVHDTQIMHTLGIKNIDQIYYHDGTFFERKFQLSTNQKKSSFGYLLKKMETFRMRKYSVKQTNYFRSPLLLSELESVLATFYFLPEPYVFQIIQNYLKKSGLHILFYFDDEVIEFSDSSDILISDLVLLSESSPVFSSYKFLSTHSLNETDPRKIALGEELSLLWEPFMKLSIIHQTDAMKSVLLPDGNWVTPCDVCVNRLKKLTMGCNTCKPIIKRHE